MVDYLFAGLSRHGSHCGEVLCRVIFVVVVVVVVVVFVQTFLD
jgi:hypothetical protein